MLDSHAIARTDTFTFTAAGRPWLNQQWLSQLILAVTYKLGGWMALAGLRSLFTAVALALVYLACRARGASIRRAAALATATGLLLLAGFKLRPQLLGFVCFALTIWLLASRRAHPIRAWLTVPVIAFWANVHGTFFLGPALIGLAWLEDVLARDRRALRLVLVGLAALAATLANPYGATVWSYAAQLSTNPAVRGLVLEWQRTSIDSYSGAIFFASVVGVAVVIARGPGRPAFPALIALLCWFVLGLTSVRAVYWWGLAMPVTLAGIQPVRDHDPTAEPSNAANTVIAAVLCLTFLVAFARWLPFRESVPERLLSHAPAGITRALRETVAPGERLFNAQAWGSWFELALPSNPVAVDSRIELIPAGSWSLYGNVSRGREGWQQTLDTWRVRVVALSRVQNSALFPHIERDPGWNLSYRDLDGAIFIRR
jgi:hypothetical protein